MRRYSIDVHMVHYSFRLVVTIFFLLGFLVQNVAGSAYYSLLMEPNATVTSPPVILQNGTAGTSTIYMNETSADVSVEGVWDLQLYVNADDGTKTGWTRVGTNPYLDAIDYNANYTYVSGANMLVGDFGFEDSGKSAETINSVTVQIYARHLSSKDLEVFVWNGSSWASLGLQTLSTSWRWENYTATSVLDTWAKIDGAEIYLRTIQGAGSYEVDCARLQVDYTSVDFDHVLKVNNTDTDSWEIRLKKYSDSNINRLQNCTIYFHNSTNGVSGQIYIENGLYTQDVGPWYNLPSSSTIYIAMTVEANSTSTSYVNTYLEILTPSTTTYAQYTITFEIT